MNLLGNKLVLIAPKDSKTDQVAIGQGFDLAKLAGDGRIATGDVAGGAGRQIRQGGAGKARCVAGRGAEIRHGGECARGAVAGRARRSALGIVYETDAKVEPGVKIVGSFPLKLASADHLSGRRNHDRQAGDGGYLDVPAQRRGEVDLREIRLHLPDSPDVS